MGLWRYSNVNTDILIFIPANLLRTAMSTKHKLDDGAADPPEVSVSKRPVGALHQYAEPDSFLSAVLCADVRGLIADYLYRDPDYLYVTQCDRSWCHTHTMHKTRCCLAHVETPTHLLCLTAVQQEGCALQFVPEPLRTEALCLAAVQQDGYALVYVPEPLRTEAVYLAAVQQDGLALQCVPKPLWTEAVCLATVQQNGLALQYVPEPLRTEALCLTAVQQNGYALRYVPEPLRTEALFLTAVQQNGDALRYVPEPLRTEALCLAAVQQDGCALQFVPAHLGAFIFSQPAESPRSTQ